MVELQTPVVGCIVHYTDSSGNSLHSGIVTGVSNGVVTSVVSKWGEAGLYQHALLYVPSDYLDFDENRNKIGIREYYSYPDPSSHSYTGSCAYTNEYKHYTWCSVSGCGLYLSEDHTYSSWSDYSSQYHRKICSGCGHVIDKIHSFSGWAYYNGVNHKRSCSVCGRTEYAKHVLNKEETMCIICGSTGPFAINK